MTQYITLGKNTKDIVGQTFNRLTVLGYVGSSKWECQCSCGMTTIVETGNLKSGHTKSCGCFVRDMLVERNTTHGMAHSPTYGTWLSMVHRCHHPNSLNYSYYGERGISVCDEWRNSPEAFHNYVTKLPDYGKEGYTLDRINNDGNYEPDNVRWASQDTQVKNTRHTRLITYDDRTQCIVDWARELHMHPNTLRTRLNWGWDVETAFFAPIQRHPIPR